MPDRYRQLPGGAASCPAFACNEEVSMTAWPVYGHAPASSIALCCEQIPPRQAIGPGRLAKNETVPVAISSIGDIMDRHESTAGRGDPYWYEWFVGLTEVVDLLDPATEIVSVAF